VSAVYSALVGEGYAYVERYSSIYFVDERTGGHTNRTVATRKNVQAVLMPCRRKSDCILCLSECMVRQKCEAEDTDLVCKFMELVAMTGWNIIRNLAKALVYVLQG
jgi:hypothetical protein